MSSNNTRKGAQTEAGAGTKRHGQKVSRERGTATNHKKNPGKRPHKGGS